MKLTLTTSCLATLAAFLFEDYGSQVVNAAAFDRLITPTLDIGYATLNGYTNSANNITTFLGVPYAEPPTNGSRFRRPATIESSWGTIDASHFAAKCIPTVQREGSVEGTSEDCLYANVYVPPGTKLSDRLPVLVYFHGGGFQGGDTREYSGDDLLMSSSNPLIYISFSYRLGHFGFLAGSKVAANGEGNAGLLDQREALRWVQRYIHYFGGDKSQVTLWGQSAGAGLVMYQLLAKEGDTEGLFHRAIGNSPPSSFMPSYDSDEVESIFEQVASLAGCLPEDDDVMDCLRTVDTAALTYAGSQTLASRPSTLYPFSPILDGFFISNRPVDAIARGKFAKVPIMFGSNHNDGASWSGKSKQPEGNTTIPGSTEDNVYFFLRGQYPHMSNDTFAQLLKYYPLSDCNNSVVAQVQQMYGEARFICTATMLADGAAVKGIESYNYRYENPITGSNHHDELAGMFLVPRFEDPSVNTLFSDMRQYWTNFVTTGIPTADNATKWEATSSQNKNARLHLYPGNTKMEELPQAQSERCNFWHSLNELQT